jgi:DNA (cytosine-5)-methyltransferase 1
MAKAKITYSSVCSGIETSHLALQPLGFQPLWFSETASFPSKLLKYHYPNIPNYGDMLNLSNKIEKGEVEAPQLFCGGTPCNSFSTLGKQKGLSDERGMLSLEFCHIADTIDRVRIANKEGASLILWENVEGVLKDKGNAFGIFLNHLTENESTLKINKWNQCGIVVGKKRTAVWRVLDAVRFGLPQQRKRVFVLATANSIYNIADMLIERGDYAITLNKRIKQYESITKDLSKVEVFSNVSNCLSSCYGEKYNGNHTANNGAMFVAENGKLRRFTPIECERLMGIPDNYTLLPNVKGDISRYKALGNAWAVNVIEWIGKRICTNPSANIIKSLPINSNGIFQFNGCVSLDENAFINGTTSPYNHSSNHIFNILQDNVDKKYYLTVPICEGILRRSKERGLNMNRRVEALMKSFISRSKLPQTDKTSLLTTLGSRIKNIRKLHHLTQKELATHVGLSNVYIARLENGKENISILNLEKIANALGVEVKFFF